MTRSTVYRGAGSSSGEGGIVKVAHTVRRSGGAVLVKFGTGGTAISAMLEVIDGATVIDVARRNGVSRQTVHVGCGRTRPTVWPGWRIGARAHTRCRLEPAA